MYYYLCFYLPIGKFILDMIRQLYYTMNFLENAIARINKIMEMQNKLF